MSEFALEDINEDDDAKLARVTKEEYQALVLSLSGKLFMHEDLVKVASKLMSNFTMDRGVMGHTYDGKEITGDVYYYHNWQIEQLNNTWVFEDISLKGTSQMFSDPHPMQGMLSIDVMMKNEGIA